jgi:4-amino-4-deoxy-L-arabinose transferase-like glycosyltransferase
MARLPHTRAAHYALLLTATAALTLPGLGSFSLWDIDEGLNAEAAREMLESGNWVVPTFNFKPRTAKPALLYWLQAFSYQRFGVNEFAARLPSALATAAAVLLTYELGRRMFAPSTGLLAGVVLVSTVQVCVLAHAATPDALLLACLMLTFWLFWTGYASGGRRWTWTVGLGCGLAVLAKGPVGLALPAAVIGYYLLAQRELRRLFDARLLGGLLLVVLVAGPWYALVGAETHGAFLRTFWRTENVGRFLSAMEGHSGPVVYYPLTILIGLAPWSIVLGAVVWEALREARRTEDRGQRTEDRGQRTEDSKDSLSSVLCPLSSDATRFLLCWAVVYVGFFSLAQTKLPNYVLPAYPPLALLTAHYLDRWRRGEVRPARWVLPVALGSLAAVGVVVAAGLLVAGGALAPAVLGDRAVAGLAGWAWVGLVPVLAAAAGVWCLRRERRAGLIAGLAAGAVAFVGLMATLPVRAVDAYKAPRPLVATAGACQPGEEVRVGCYAYFQPSLVFYCRREVSELLTEQQALEFLRSPLPAYLVCPATVGEALAARAAGACRMADRRPDLFRGTDIVILTNR